MIRRTHIYAAVALAAALVLTVVGLHSADVRPAHAQAATFADGFEDGDDSGWLPRAGTWQVVDDGTGNNQVYEQTASGAGVGTASLIEDRSWKPFHLSVRVTPADLEPGDAIRILFRYDDPDNHYLVFLTQASIQVRRWSNGELTTIAQEPAEIASGTSYQLDLEGRGDHFQVHLDKTLKLSVRDNTHEEGQVAVGTWQTGASFDDVTVSRVVRMGVGQSNLYRYADGDRQAQLGVLDAMRANGMTRTRLTLARGEAEELDAVNDFIPHANSIGLHVLLGIGLSGNSDYYAPMATKVQRANFPAVYRLSDLRLDRFENALRGYLQAIDGADPDAEIKALAIGNEANWIGFNGDLPEVPGGKIFGDATPWNDPAFQKVREGIDKWGQAIERAEQVADEVFGPGKVKIVTGGFADIPDCFVRGQDASIVEPGLFLQLLQGSHPRQSAAPDYIEHADHIGTHVYPFRPYDLDPVAGYQSIKNHIASVMNPVVHKIGTPRTFWIDEFGFRRTGINGGPDVTEDQRLDLFRWFMLALHDREFDGINWGNVYVYNFVDNPALSVYEDGALLGAGQIFAEHPY